MSNVEALTSILIANLFICPTYIPYYLAIFYFNPYSFIIWINGKNHTDEIVLKDIYYNKDKLKRFKTYLKYLSMVALSNALEL
jgi:hypothetical protein